MGDWGGCNDWGGRDGQGGWGGRGGSMVGVVIIMGMVWVVRFGWDGLG